MSDFAGMEDLLQDFLQEAGELLSDVDNKLVDLERSPDDHRLLNDIFRGFHTIKGGAGFLNAGELVSLCHLTENLFDRLRNAALTLTPALMDTIMAATQSVRNMFGEIAQGRQPDPAPLPVMANLRAALPSRRAPPSSRRWRQPPDGGAATAAPAAPFDRCEWPGLAGPARGGDRPDAGCAERGPPERCGRRRDPASEVDLSHLQPHFPPEGRRTTDKPGAAVNARPVVAVPRKRLPPAKRRSGSIRRVSTRCSTCRARSA
jgi:two-component system chemotaxis sensor kinase CheA